MTDQVEHIPVAAPDPQLIQQLFDEDPLKLSEENLDTIIAFFRQQRVDYLQPAEEKPKKTKAPKVSAEQAAAAADLLSDLGL